MKESRDPQLQKHGDGRGFMSGYFIRYTYAMKDTRPSRKTSKAQDNIREYLADIAMGCTTHFAGTTVRSWKSRYKDFEKSEKQAWADFENYFDGVPTVNEVEAPEMQDVVVIERYDDVIVLNTEQADILERWDRITDKITTRLLIGAFATGGIIGMIGQYLYMVAR